MYLLLPTVFRHGVEHMDSTVIAMGPLAELANEEVYRDFLAISSHELFHLWNVKRIRPTELLPYDFTKENYSSLGYVYEGVTTYYGDLALWLSGVWNWEQYNASLSGDLSKHLNNEGRNFYSVAESSFDTWLDGYVLGVPGRKVSIYTEGLVAALIADVMIIEATKGEKRLHEVMKTLYVRTWKHGVGYSKEMYQEILEEIAGISFSGYFSELIEGKGTLENKLFETLSKLGLSTVKQLDENGNATYKIVKLLDTTDSQAQLFDFWSQRR
jgi:predicted metalloprotease with PDZ domain